MNFQTVKTIRQILCMKIELKEITTVKGKGNKHDTKD